jgi:hypothetical protein
MIIVDEIKLLPTLEVTYAKKSLNKRTKLQ